MKEGIVIGSGFSGLSAAAFLAEKGIKMTVIEKNNQIGGRARKIESQGYCFDMGPSWYWMHDIFENFFNHFNRSSNEFYKLKKLDPGFKIIFDSEEIAIPSNFKETCKLFKRYEVQGDKKLLKFMKDAEKKYKIGLSFLYKSPGLSLTEFFKTNLIFNLGNLTLLSSYRKHIKKYFKHPLLIHILEFPVLFLGATADKMPALYSLMSYSGIKDGTFYPIGGFHEIIKGMKNICDQKGVKFLKNEEVTKINVKNRKAYSITTINQTINTDFVVASADYAHVESCLLEKEFRNYDEEYWKRKKFSPSALIFYLGIKKKLKNLEHHNLFFDEDVEKNSADIYIHKRSNKNPLFYVCCPSKTDIKVAPIGKENIFILMPISAGIKDNNKIREKYFEIIIDILEKYTNCNIKEHIEHKKSYCINDFQNDYNAYKGNAYGLANTLDQTANLKPKIINNKITNLFYTGQLTVHGPGVPPSIISGQIVSEYIIKNLKKI